MPPNEIEYTKEYLSSRWNWLTEDIEDAELKLKTQLILERSYRQMIAAAPHWMPPEWLKNKNNKLMETE